MADTYQAIYDAVRSRIHGTNVGEVVAEQARQAFDISLAVACVRDEFASLAMEQQRPSVLYRPSIGPDGNKWCALYGANLVDGVAGFGETPAEAMLDFDRAWTTERCPSKRKDRQSICGYTHQEAIDQIIKLTKEMAALAGKGAPNG
jgi:hypothetical protein